VIRIDLGGPVLEFVHVPDEHFPWRYAAELDGRRVPIRCRMRYKDDAASNYLWGDWSEDMTMLMSFLSAIEDVTPTRDGDAFRFFAVHEYDHFQGGTKGWRSVAAIIAFRDGKVEVDVELDESADY
jgi:hypothetical protein